MTVNVKHKSDKGEQRRTALLDAALRLICRDGIRGVRHRAVANEAGVPLSATTYYFDSIDDLITESFMLFAQRAMRDVVEPAISAVSEYLHTLPANVISDQHYERVAQLIVAHIQQELDTKREHLLIEQTFLHESLRLERLKPLALQYHEHLCGELVVLCEFLQLHPPRQAASTLLSLILQLEWYGLALPQGQTLNTVQACQQLSATLKGLSTVTQRN